MATASLDTENARLGRDLDELLRRLRETRTPTFSIGPQEAIDCHRLLVALIGASPRDGGLQSFADVLGPIVARSPEERRAFERIIRDLGPPPPTPPPPPPPDGSKRDDVDKDEEGPRDRWRRIVADPRNIGGAIFLLLVLLALGLALFGRKTADQPDSYPAPSPQSQLTAPQGTTTAYRDQIPAIVPPSSVSSAADRLSYAASIRNGAPTLRELARTLAPTAKVPMSPDEYLRRLKALTGFASDRPLPVLWPDAPSPPSGFGQGLDDIGFNRPQLEWAISQIDDPGDVPTLMDVADQDTESGRLRPPVSAEDRRWDETATRLLFYLRDSWREAGPETKPNSRVELVAANLRKHLPEALKTSPGISDGALARVYAMVHPEWSPPDAPWLPEPAPDRTAPSWAGWLAALAAAVLVVLLALPLLDPRRAFLRRRPPKVRPHRSRLIGNMPQVALGGPATYREIRKSLQRREPRPTRQLDIRATVRATLSAGGMAIMPRFASTRAAPDYLVLIDRRSLTDLEAERAAALVAPLRTGAIGVDLYFFNSDPSRVYSESGGSSLAIEELMARYPHHRLILMGSGEEMLDLYSGRATGGYARLGHWRRRGLLTPVPRREWAREEALIAREFNAPVARSTSGGLLALARHLLAEAGRRPKLFPDGDEGAPPLPRRLVRLLREAPGNAETVDPDYVEELLEELSFYPDAPGFEWLCAIAVYPAATFDLALFLGQRLPEWSGAPEDRTLYSPARLAALTRLPWLREGGMPNWLRRALIDRLSPERAGQVRGVILALVASAEESGGEAGNRAGFGQEPARGPAPQRLFDDEVMVEFLRSGKSEDLAIDLPGPRPRLRSLRERIDVHSILAASLVLACAGTAWFVAPAPADGPSAPVLWVPLVLLAILGLGIAAAIRPVSASLIARRFAIRMGPFGLALAVLAGVALVQRLVSGGGATPIQAVEQASAPTWGWPQFLLAFLALGLWPYAAERTARLRGEPWKRPSTTPDRIRFICWSVGSALVAGFATYLAWSSRAGGAYYLTALLALGAGLFTAGIRLRRPRRMTPQPDLARLRRLSRRQAVLALLPAFLLLLVPIWAAWEIRGDRAIAAAADGHERLVATSPDGSLVATAGGKDGRDVEVFAAADPRKILWRGSVQPFTVSVTGTYKPRFGQSRISALAVARLNDDQPSSPILVAAATLDGALVGFDGEHRQVTIFPDEGNDFPNVRPDLVFARGGLLVCAFHTLDGQSIVAVSSQLRPGGGGPVRMTREQQRRITSLASFGPYLVWTGANGEVTAARAVSGQRVVPLQLVLLDEPGGAPHDRLRAGARLIRSVRPDGDRPRFIAVADDGSAVLGTIDPVKNSLSTVRVRPIRQLAVGPAIPWAARASADVGTPQPPSAGAKPGGSTSAVAPPTGLPRVQTPVQRPPVEVPVQQPIQPQVSQGEPGTQGLDPRVAQLATEIAAFAEKLGFDARIEGYRSATAQSALYARGRSAAGPVVTNARWSTHNTGLAFDILLLKDGKMVDDKDAYRQLGAIGKKLGLVWGGDSRLPDYPHFESRDAKAALAKLRAGAAGT